LLSAKNNPERILRAIEVHCRTRVEISGSVREVFVATLLVATFFTTPSSAQASGDLASILAGLADRTQQYYDRFISIICTETVTTQDLRFNLTPVGRPRITVYELSVARDPQPKGATDFRVQRTLQSVNGRPARKNQRPECTDPKTGTPDPLGFLLAKNQSGYQFSIAEAKGGPPGARALDFIESPPERVRVTWEGSCFEAEGGGHQGRVWYDPTSYDVLQVELRLSKPFLIPLPNGYFGIRPAIRVERSEMTLRFSRVEFQQPDETVLLPDSIDTLQVLRGVPSLRIHQKLANYRRFLTKAEIRSGP
jgi:hypothetical protein